MLMSGNIIPMFCLPALYTVQVKYRRVWRLSNVNSTRRVWWCKQEFKCVVTDTPRGHLKLKLRRSLQSGSSVPLFRTKILLPLLGTSTKFSCFLSDPYFHPTRHAAFKWNLDARNIVVSCPTIALRHGFSILGTKPTLNFISPKPSPHKLQYT